MPLASQLPFAWCGSSFSVQFGDIKDRISKSVSAIEAEADVAEKELANQERKKNIDRWATAERTQQAIADFIDEQSVTKVNEWLAPVNVALNHKTATKLRHADSGTWFFRGVLLFKHGWRMKTRSSGCMLYVRHVPRPSGELPVKRGQQDADACKPRNASAWARRCCASRHQ